MANRKTDLEALKAAIRQDWPKTPGKGKALCRQGEIGQPS